MSTGNEAEGSLAAAAAAWVPPWARRPEPEPASEPELAAEVESAPEPEAELAAEIEPASEPESAAEVEPAPEPEAELAAEIEPAPEPELAAEVEPAPEPDPEPAAESAPAVAPADSAESAAGSGQDPSGSDDVTQDHPNTGDTAGEPGSAAQEQQHGVPAHDLRPALEAILLVVDEPVSEAVLAEVLELPTTRIDAELTAIAAEYEAHGRGFELRRAAGGWRLYTRPEYGGYVERFVLDGQSVRLTQASLETLAVIAYKQPVTRSRISAIRGVNCDGTVRTLVTRGLIEQCGTESETGAHLYRTTVLFLEKLGLDSVEQLPDLAPYVPDNVDEIADAQQ